MRKVIMICIMLLSMGWTLAVTRAQEPLTETFTAADGSFSFMYPAGWTVTPGENGSVKIDLHLPINFDEFTFRESGSTAKQFILDFIPGRGVTESDVVEFQVNGHSAARVTVPIGSSNLEYIAVDFPDGKLLTIQVDALADKVTDLEPTLLAIVASFQAPAGSGAAPAVADATVVAPPVSAINGVSEIVFPSSDVGYSDLFIVEPSGANLTQFTQNQRNATLPVWSPDGTKLAYMADTGQTGYAFDVFVVGADGANPVKLSSHPSDNAGAIVWSPDSTQLIFKSGRADSDGGPGLYKVNADGSGETKLNFDGVDGKFINNYALDWSHDGKQIVFIAFPTAGPDWTLLFADPNGGAVTPGPDVNIAQVADYFKWSPDGQHVLYSDNSTVTVMNPDGSSPTALVDSSEGLFVLGVAWSPDGSQVAFTGYVLSSAEPVSQLYIVNADGSNRQPVDLGTQSVSNAGLTWGIVPGG